MSISNVVNLFLQNGLECSIINPIEQNLTSHICVVKPFVFRIGSEYITIVTESKVKISYEKFIGRFKTTPRQLSKLEIRNELGFPRESINFAELKKATHIYFDYSLKQRQKFYASAGIKNLLVEVRPRDAISITHGEWIDIAE